MNKKLVLIAIYSIFYLLTSVFCFAYAEDKPGTTAGTDIIARIASFNVEYSDGAQTTSDVINKDAVSDLVTPVQSIYGLRFVTSEGELGGNINLVITGGTGAVLMRQMVFENYGNTTDAQITFATGSYTLEQAGGDASTAEQWLANTTLTAPSGPFAEGDDIVVTLSVTIPAGVVNGTTWNILVSANTASTPNGEYTGFNGTSYGGASDVTKNARFKVSGTPYLEVISHTSTVTAAGGKTGPVPGSKVKYTIVLENKAPTATAAAKDIVLEQTIPVDTTYYVTEPMEFTADDSVLFTTSNVGTKCTWTQNNSGVAALKTGSRITLNYTVTID